MVFTIRQNLPSKDKYMRIAFCKTNGCSMKPLLVTPTAKGNNSRLYEPKAVSHLNGCSSELKKESLDSVFSYPKMERLVISSHSQTNHQGF